MELIDIFDNKGNKTGKIRTKSEVHTDGLWHQTVHIWCINSKNEILLQHRAKNKENFPDMWDISVAGHVQAGEDPISASIREIKEEIGLNILPEKLQFLGKIIQEITLNNGTYLDNEFNNVYLLKIDTDIKEFEIQKEELEELKWIQIDEFKKWISQKRSDLVPHLEEYDLLLSKI